MSEAKENKSLSKVLLIAVVIIIGIYGISNVVAANKRAALEKAHPQVQVDHSHDHEHHAAPYQGQGSYTAPAEQGDNQEHHRH